MASRLTLPRASRAVPDIRLSRDTAFLSKGTALLSKGTAFLSKDMVFLSKDMVSLSKDTAHRLPPAPPRPAKR
jgi:hypothetical protein